MVLPSMAGQGRHGMASRILSGSGTTVNGATGQGKAGLKKEETMKTKHFVCVLCEQTIIGQWGNNPWPLATVGKCCDRCDENYVLPERLSVIYGRIIEQAGLGSRG